VNLPSTSFLDGSVPLHPRAKATSNWIPRSQNHRGPAARSGPPLVIRAASMWRPCSRIAMLALLGAQVLGAFAVESDRVVGRGSATGALELELCSSLRRAQAVVAAALDPGRTDQTAGGVRTELRLKAQLGLSSLEAELRRTTAWIDRARRAIGDAAVSRGRTHAPASSSLRMRPHELLADDTPRLTAAVERNSSVDAPATVAGRRLLQTDSITNSNIKAAVMDWVAIPATAVAKYGDISKWNTAAVANMGALFAGATTFNADLSRWNTASATSLKEMFYGAAHVALRRSTAMFRSGAPAGW
jgi:hypothetical protein